MLPIKSESDYQTKNGENAKKINFDIFFMILKRVKMKRI